jgi:preprotein translocase subunit SecE
MEKIKLIKERIIRFLKEAKGELKKVTWPTPKQTLASTSVVIIVVIIVSVFLGIVDFGLAKVIRLVLG